MVKSFLHPFFIKDRALNASSPDAPFAHARPSFERILGGFGDIHADMPRDWACHHPKPEDFPVPELLLILLRDVMGFDTAGPMDKIRWAVYFSVDGEPIRIELAKAGLRMCYGRHGAVKIDRVVGQLRSALGRLEKLLAPLMKEAIHSGDATIVNRSYEFRDRYMFFREKAATPFARQAPHQGDAEPKFGGVAEAVASITEIFESFSAERRHKTIAFYNSVAMIDAYFSYLENRATLLRAFLGTPVEKGGLAQFMRARWDDKLTLISPDRHSGEFKGLLSRLRGVKEKIRNPFAHGGSENDGGSIFCHVTSVGAIPGNMSGFKGSARFQLIPVDTEDNASICQLFDEVDAYLCSGQLAIPSRLADGGINAAWDASSLAQYAELNVAALPDVERYIDLWNAEQDRHDNMEY